jgi:starch synthase
MQVVFAASECTPFAKTGGLADVVGALPPELVKLGHQVTVYLPLYKSVRPFLPEELTFAVRSITVPFPYYNRFAGVVDGGLRDGVQFYFIDCPELFDRDGFYGPKTGAGDYGDNAERFGLFCRAVLEAAKQLGVPEIFHVHDWQAALLPILLRTVYYFDPAMRSAAVVLTIHNAGYQGWFPPTTTVPLLLLPWDVSPPWTRWSMYDTFNFLKGVPVVFSDSADHGEPAGTRRSSRRRRSAPNLDGSLRRRAIADLRGISERRGLLASGIRPRDGKSGCALLTPENLEGKIAHAARDLSARVQSAVDVPDTTPVIGIVSRFATQKGFDIVEQIAGSGSPSASWCIVALGSAASPYYENFFRDLGVSPGLTSIAVQLKLRRIALAHKVEAGAGHVPHALAL